MLNSLHSNYDLLKTRGRKVISNIIIYAFNQGIPQGMRTLVWPKLVEIDKLIKNTGKDYQDFVK